MTQSTLSEALAVYYEAKTLLLQDAADFRLLDAGPLKCFHKHPNWPEVDSFLALDVSPAEAVTAIQGYQPNTNHMLRVLTPAPEVLIEAYQELGYKALPNNESFMMKSLLDLPASQEQAAVHVRQTQAITDYWVEADGEPVCWGKSTLTFEQAIYVSGMETLPPFRRRGLASVLLKRIHKDAAQQAAAQSILVSTPMGLPLYLSQGYVVLAQVQAFVPVKQAVLEGTTR